MQQTTTKTIDFGPIGIVVVHLARTLQLQSSLLFITTESNEPFYQIDTK